MKGKIGMKSIQEKQEYLFNQAIYRQLDFNCYLKDIKDTKEIIRIRREFENNIILLLKRCQSPIEEILCLACLDCPEEISVNSLFPQYKIDNYTVDLLCKLPNGKSIIFEADGHDFHEKTKEQARHDKERDRYITSRGLNVYRFTGSEIFSNTLDVVIEISEIIINESYGDDNE